MRARADGSRSCCSKKTHSTIGGPCCARANARARALRSFSETRADRRLTFKPQCSTRMLKAIGGCASRAHPTSPTCSMSSAKSRCRPTLCALTRTGWERSASDSQPGSVAAPTAGLHFTEALLADLSTRGVEVDFLTLHVGLGTFAPVKAETIAAHTMHEERYALSEQTPHAINEAKSASRRVIAVGTTTVPALETLAGKGAQPAPA